jgi:cobalt-precorrin 5A hydrolase
LDEQGRFVISLVSGHIGGANQLAARVAQITGGAAVITTASDVSKKPALDLIARDLGLEIENIDMLGRVSRSILEDEPFLVYDPEGRLKTHLGDAPNLIRVEKPLCGLQPSDTGVSRASRDPIEQCIPGAEASKDRAAMGEARAGIWVSECHAPQGGGWLILRPKNLVVGVGCNRGTPAGEILGFLQATFREACLSPLSIRNLASAQVKADEPGVLEAARVLGRPIVFYEGKEIKSISVPNPSAVVLKHVGVPSVCEATALLSAGSSDLIVAKQKTTNVTLAVARAKFPL